MSEVLYNKNLSRLELLNGFEWVFSKKLSMLGGMTWTMQKNQRSSSYFLTILYKGPLSWII